MTAWSVAVEAMLPALAVPVVAALRGSVAHRLAALQLASGMLSVILLLMSFAFDQDSYTSMAVAASLLGTTAALVLSLTIERWL